MGKLLPIYSRIVMKIFTQLKRLLGRILAKYVPGFHRRIQYKRMYGKWLNLHHPKTFHEKIYWLEKNTDTSEWTRLTDKVTVRDYVKECGLEDILNEVYAVYDTPEEVNFDTLPNSFVMKLNNGGGGAVHIVKDKNGINRQELLRQLSMEFKHNYGVYTAQKHYQRIVPRIIVEKLLIENNAPSQPITDYKFYCFHGEPKYIQRISGRDFKTHIAKKSFFDMNWKWIPLLEEESTLGIHKPFMLEKMIAISKILSKPFPFVRVDLYLIENKIIFGEMTFTPGQSETGYYYKLNSGRLGDLIHL